MKQEVERRKPEGLLDHVSLAVTTFGVGFLPLAPGTWGSAVAAGFYYFLARTFASFRYAGEAVRPEYQIADMHAAILVALLAFIFLGIWAADRSIELLGNSDSPHAVVDELIGQFVTFLFIPFTTSIYFVAAGFLLFRLFDIWKPYPIDSLQALPGGIGVCADDILAGVYAGVVLSIIYAVSLSI